MQPKKVSYRLTRYHLVLQVLVCLEWLVNFNSRFQSFSDNNQSERDSDSSKSLSDLPCLDDSEVWLAGALWQLLYQLLIPQLLDLSLDMENVPIRILLCATPTLDQCILPESRPFTQLVSATLSRIIQDKAQYKPDPAASASAHPGGKAYHKFMQFWQFMGMIPFTISCAAHFSSFNLHVPVL